MRTLPGTRPSPAAGITISCRLNLATPKAREGWMRGRLISGWMRRVGSVGGLRGRLTPPGSWVLGRRLMDQAIGFCRQAPSLAWLDLRVFGHNANARALYRSLGFVEVGVVEDRFRIGDKRIYDVIMTLALADERQAMSGASDRLD